MRPKGLSVVDETGNAYTPLGWARGPRPAWRRGARLVRRAVDVGLDSSVPSHQGEGTKKTAGIDTLA